MFDHLTAHCLASAAMSQGSSHNQGACQGIAPDGSQIYLTYTIDNDGKSITGENHFVSGTGRFMGISGGGTISGLHLPGPDGKVMYVSQHQVQWKLP